MEMHSPALGFLFLAGFVKRYLFHTQNLTHFLIQAGGSVGVDEPHSLSSLLE